MLRTLGEHAFTPVRLPLGKIDVLNTLLAPVVRPAPSLVAHFKTLHAYTSPQSLRRWSAGTERTRHPPRLRMADAVIINSESLRSEVQRYLDVDPAKLRLIPEAVDHELFHPGDAEEARPPSSAGGTASLVRSSYSSPRCGRTRTARGCSGLRPRPGRPGRPPARGGGAGPGRGRTSRSCTPLPRSSASPMTWSGFGGVPLEETPTFYRAADVFVYPLFNATFGLPLLEAMACAARWSPRTPVPCRRLRAAPRRCPTPATRPLSPPGHRPSLRESGEKLRRLGRERATEFTWAATAAATLDVYREVHAREGGTTMRVLVTGGAGFIGSHTCDRLVGSATRSPCSMR